MAWISRLPAASPATAAAPLSPPLRMLARDVNRRPPLVFSHVAVTRPAFLDQQRPHVLLEELIIVARCSRAARRGAVPAGPAGRAETQRKGRAWFGSAGEGSLSRRSALGIHRRLLCSRSSERAGSDSGSAPRRSPNEPRKPYLRLLRVESITDVMIRVSLLRADHAWRRRLRGPVTDLAVRAARSADWSDRLRPTSSKLRLPGVDRALEVEPDWPST